MSDGSMHAAPGVPREICDALVGWYAGAKRELPWRHTRDPYAIWVSEVMLQQTRVDTVIPFYRRFLARFPTVTALAEAELEAVLAAWSGLGYYRRARALHHAAGEVVERYGGALPERAAELATLRGVGRYTAGAIASIAFGERAPVVDGNVTRVLSRVYGIDDDVSAPATKRRLWALAGALVPEQRPGDLNQALMELGATLCTPRAPRCTSCPLAARCVARGRGDQEALPRAKPKRSPRTVQLVSVVAACGSELLLGRRSAAGLFGGLWEPPMVEGDSVGAARAALGELGVSPRAKLSDAGTVRHVLTHRVMEVRVQRGDARRPWRLPAPNGVVYDELAWRRSGDVPLSTLARKVIHSALALAVWLIATTSAGEAAGQEAKKKPEQESGGEANEVTAADLELYKRLNEERGGYGRVLFALGGGKGLRFNNPFRLRDQLGESAESVSATAGYVDLSLAATFGEPDGLQHGGALHFAIAAEGVAQQALSASYLALYRGPSAWMFHGRLGVSILTAPDANAGGELAVGLSYFFTGAIGLTSELVGNLFYGAGTYEAEVTAVPVLSLQGGLIIDFEVLP